MYPALEAALSVLLCLLACAHGINRPSIPSQFVSPVTTELQYIHNHPKAPKTQTGYMAYSSTAQRLRLDLNWHFPPPWVSLTNFTLAPALASCWGRQEVGWAAHGLAGMITTGQKDGWYVKNGLCHYPLRPYHDIFDWTAHAVHEGTTVINDVPVDAWSDPFNPSNALYTLLGNLFQSSIPVKLESGSDAFSFDTDQFTIIGNGVTMKEFNPPPRCTVPGGFVCPEGSVELLNITRFHGPSDSLSNNNVADVLGDAYYMCSGSAPPQDQYISFYEIEVNTTWAQYGKCNDGQCRGRNLHLVGREQPNGWGYLGGQCADVNELGTWYSLPAQAECADGVMVGANCAWRKIVKCRVLTGNQYKTIAYSCLRAHGFADACAKDGEMPFTNAGEVLATALAFSDPSAGGCPAVEL